MFQILGVWLNSKFIWEKQVDMSCNKLTQQKYSIQQASIMLPLDSLKLLYNSYIHSNISYEVLVSGSMISKKSIDQLECKQKRVIQRIMKLNKRESITFKVKENDILLFIDIFKLELCKFCYLFKSDCIPHALKVLMPSN